MQSYGRQAFTPTVIDVHFPPNSDRKMSIA